MDTRHTVSDRNPTYVTGANRYRIPFTLCLTPEHPDFAALQEFFAPERRCAEGYGLAFLESEEHSVIYVGAIQQIHAYREANADGTAILDVSLGHCYAFWPQGNGWDQLIPANTWNPGGRGILTEFDHGDTKVVVYEFVEDHDGEQVPMVAFHCLRCHNDHRIHFDHKSENRGPQDRRWIARHARVHIRDVSDECRPMDPSIAAIVTAVANEKLDTSKPVITHESHCATTGPCSQIRHLRATA